jgi:carbohydrate-binding protein (putative mucin)
LLVGAVYARQLPINSQTLVLPELPIGVYTLRLPTGRNYKYQPQLGYLVVKPGQNKQQVDFVRKTTSTLASQEIILLGLGDGIFCTVLVDQVNRVVKVDVNRTTPHSYFPDVTYAEVVIKNKGGVEQFRKTIPGTNATISHDEVPFEVGYLKLQIYHEEPKHRVKLSPAFDGVIDNKTKTNVFEITASGLENEALQNDPQNALLAQIERAATALRGNYTMLHAECDAKVDIFLAINLFPSPQRESLLRQYADCIPANNSPPEEVHVGDNFTSSLINGIVDRTACFFG